MSKQLSHQSNWDSIMRSLDFRGQDVADVGCGYGWFAATYFQQAKSLLLIDQNPEHLARALAAVQSQPDATCTVQTVQSNFMEHTFPAESLDTIASIKTY